TIFSRVHPEEKEILLKKMHHFAGNCENPILQEFRILHKSGEYIWVSSRGRCVEHDEKGKALRIVGTYTDITDRKLFEIALKQKNEELQTAEEELRATNDELLMVNEKLEKQNDELQITYEKLKISEEKFKQLADNIEDTFWLWEKSRLIYLSPTFEKIFDIKLADAMLDTKVITAVIHPEDRPKVNIFSEEVILESEGSLTNQFRIIKHDGSIRWIWSRIFPVYNKNGQIYRIAGVASDITQQKELENELRMAKDKAQESDRLKSTFLANISHEIRTPMNGIVGFAGLLTRDDLNEENRNRYIEIVNKSSDQLLHIIEDLIDISKIEANQMQIRMEPCDLNELMDELHTIYTRELKQADKGHIELFPVYSSESEKCIIITDGLRLRQIMNNLMNNAVKFTDKGTICFGYEIENQEYIKFFVKDTGIGIEPIMTNIIFMPFRQADEGDARKYGGTGLGLPISRGLVRMLNGEIWHESAKGKGSTFFFRLPYKPYSENKDNQNNTNHQKNKTEWRHRKILIAEDDDLNYEFLYAILEPTSVSIERAIDGIQAVKLCQESEFDLILMDIRLPNLDGLQATRQIREYGLKLPIIAQTAYAMANDKEECLAAGCDDYVPKPVDKESLLHKLSRYLTE
ncbi:MAG: PAS domain-containing protein, partial [Bacteroidales bacterium]|nr:PAS domain-containing protein [Bacteroidales bacterium]